MQILNLELGKDAWARLEEGPISGQLRWNELAPHAVEARIRGAHSRKFPKRSLQITMDHDRLPDGPPDGHTVRRVHLNADYIDPTLMRSSLSFQLFDAVGAPAPIARHAAVTVSGEFAGIYVAIESVDRHFCRRRGWAPGYIYYAVNRNANFGLVSPNSGKLKEPLEQGYQLTERADPQPLRRLLMKLNLASDRRFPATARRFLDLEGYLKWLMVAVFVGNRDGFVHNYALYCDKAEDRFRIIPWDYDATFGIDIHGRPARLDRVPVAGWNRLTDRIMGVPEFRTLYRSMFEQALDGPLAPDAIAKRIDTLHGDLAPWIDKDRQTATGERRFSEAVAALKRWPVERAALLRQQLAGL